MYNNHNTHETFYVQVSNKPHTRNMLKISFHYLCFLIYVFHLYVFVALNSLILTILQF